MKSLEDKIYNYWQKIDLFKAKGGLAKTFSIAIPPPNVTGSLHIGHAFNNTIQDIICRTKRMKGYDVLWQAGTDHAGIATQMVVERELAKKNIARQDLGREKFIKEVEVYKEKFGSNIIEQQKKIGNSCDWGRLRFTMDKGLSLAVNKIFFDLYNDGLIYQDERLVNWDTKFETAISDLEVDHRDQESDLYTIKYYLANNDGSMSNEFIEIATVRPETILADQAIAINHDHKDINKFEAKECFIPIINKKIPIVIDSIARSDFGTGAVKITPAHDNNDFIVGKKHKLKNFNIFDKKGRYNQNVAKQFIGLDRFEARKIIVKKLQDINQLTKVERIKNKIPYGDRSNTVIEPYLTKQWFVNTKKLAQRAIEVVDDKEILIYPKLWKKTYYNWLKNIQPWCISRQLWWGHRIPIYYDDKGNVFCAKDDQEAVASAGQFYKENNIKTDENISLRQDEDVLDTWFSSALWPFSTLGWPNFSKLEEKFFPTDIVVTASDILFFWVARMVMFSLYSTKKIPFNKILIHSLIRDKSGKKMSKSLGNVIDPLVLIDKYGADATRLFFAFEFAPGKDIKFDETKIVSCRNFISKLKNSAKLLKILNINFSKLEPNKSLINIDKISLNINRCLLQKLNNLIIDYEQDLNNYRFDEATNKLYHFLWHDFCDWHLEFIKIYANLYSQSEDDVNLASRKHTKEIREENQNKWQETSYVTAYVFINYLKLLHPVCPFTTEEIFFDVMDYDFDNSNKSIEKEDWPFDQITDKNKLYITDFQVDTLKKLITKIRSIKADLGFGQTQANLLINSNTKLYKLIIDSGGDYAKLVSTLAKVVIVVDQNDKQKAEQEKNKVKFVVNAEEISLLCPVEVDLVAESIKLNNKLTQIRNKLSTVSAVLENKKFLQSAPPEIIQQKKNNQELIGHEIKKIEELLKTIN